MGGVPKSRGKVITGCDGKVLKEKKLSTNLNYRKI